MKKRYPNPTWTSVDDVEFPIKTLTVLHLLSIRSWLDREGDKLADLYSVDDLPYRKDGYLVSQWKEIIDGEISRRVMLKADSTDSLWF